MAIGFVRNHQSTTNNTSNTTGLSLGIDASNASVAGNLLVAWISFDNVTNASTPTVSSIAKMSGDGGTWTRVASHNSSNATGGAGVRGEMWAIKTTVAWTANSTYTVTLSNAVTAKVGLLQEFSGAVTTLRGTAGTGTSTTSAPSAATSGTALVSGDLVVGGASFETATAITGDSDTTNGSWSTIFQQTAGSGGDAARVRSGMQYKIVNATGVQTYNPTDTTSTDSGAAVAALIPDPSATVAATVVAGSTAIGAPAVQPAQAATVAATVSVGAVTLVTNVQLTDVAGVPCATTIPTPAVGNVDVSASTVAASASVATPFVQPAQAATVAATVSVGAVTFVSSALFTPGVNVLPGAATFEDGIAGWAAIGTASVAHSTTESYTGTGSLEYTSVGAANGNNSAVCAGVAGMVPFSTTYLVVSFWIKPAVTAVSIRHEGAGAFTFDEVSGLTVGVWQRISFVRYMNSAVVGRITPGFDLRIYHGAGTSYIDDVQVEYRDGSSTASAFKVNTAVPCAATIPTPTVTVGGGNADVSATTVAAATAIGAPALFMVEEADTVVATAAVGAPTVAAGSAPTVTTVVATSTVPAPGVTLVAGVNTVFGSVAVGAPGITVVAGLSTVLAVATVAGQWSFSDDFERADGPAGNGWGSGTISSGTLTVPGDNEQAVRPFPSAARLHGSFIVDNSGVWVLALVDSLDYGYYLEFYNSNGAFGVYFFHPPSSYPESYVAPSLAAGDLVEWEVDWSQRIRIWKNGVLAVTLDNSTYDNGPPAFPYTPPNLSLLIFYEGFGTPSPALRDFSIAHGLRDGSDGTIVKTFREPATVSATTSVASPPFTSDATVFGSTVSATVVFGTPTETAWVDLFPATVAVQASVGAAQVVSQADALVSVSTVAAAVSFGGVLVEAGATAGLGVVASSVTVPAPGVTLVAGVNTVFGSVAVGAPGITVVAGLSTVLAVATVAGQWSTGQQGNVVSATTYTMTGAVSSPVSNSYVELFTDGGLISTLQDAYVGFLGPTTLYIYYGYSATPYVSPYLAENQLTIPTVSAGDTLEVEFDLSQRIRVWINGTLRGTLDASNHSSVDAPSFQGVMVSPLVFGQVDSFAFRVGLRDGSDGTIVRAGSVATATTVAGTATVGVPALTTGAGVDLSLWGPVNAAASVGRPEFYDDFERADGPAGNGWYTAASSHGGAVRPARADGQPVIDTGVLAWNVFAPKVRRVPGMSAVAHLITYEVFTATGDTDTFIYLQNASGTMYSRLWVSSYPADGVGAGDIAVRIASPGFTTTGSASGLTFGNGDIVTMEVAYPSYVRVWLNGSLIIDKTTFGSVVPSGHLDYLSVYQYDGDTGAVGVRETSAPHTVLAGSTVAAATLPATAAVGDPAIQVGSNATVSATTVDASTSAGAVTFTSDVVVGTSTVDATATVGTVTPEAGATVTTVVTDATTTVNTPGITLVAGVAAVNVTTTVGEPGIAAIPEVAPVNATTAVGAVALEASATHSATTVDVTAALPAPTPQTSVTIEPAAISVTASLTTPDFTFVAQADTVHAVVTVGAPSFASDLAIPVTTVNAATTVGTVAVEASTTISTSTVGAAVAINAPGVTLVAGVATVQAAAAVGIPVVEASQTVTAETVQVVSTVGGATFVSDATHAAVTAGAVTTVGTVVVAASATVAPGTADATTTVPAPGVTLVAGVDTVHAATTISGSADTGSTVTPATVQVATSADPPTFLSSAAAAPASVAAAVTVGDPTLEAGSTPAPPVVAGGATVGEPGITLVAGVDTVYAAAATPAPALSASAVATPAAAEAVSTVGAPAFSSDATITADAASSVATVGTPTLAASSTVAVGAAAVTATVGVPSIATEGNVTVATVTVDAAATVGTVILSGSAQVAAVEVGAVASVGTATGQAGAVAAADTVQTVTTVPDPMSSGSAHIVLSTVPGLVSVGDVVVSGDALVLGGGLAGSVSVGDPAVTAGSSAGANPVTVVAEAAVNAPGLVAGVEIQPGVVAGGAAVPGPVSAAGALVSAVTVFGVAVIPGIAAGQPHVVIGQVTIQAGSTAPTVSVSVTVSVSEPGLAQGAGAVVATAVATATIPVPGFFSHSLPQPGVVAGGATVAGVSLAGGALVAALVAQALAEVGVVSVSTARTPFRGWGVPIR